MGTTKTPTVDELAINKVRSVHRVGCYSEVKQKTWKKLKGTLLSGRSQSEKATKYVILTK